MKGAVQIWMLQKQRQPQLLILSLENKEKSSMQSSTVKEKKKMNVSHSVPTLPPRHWELYHARIALRNDLCQRMDPL